jgi:hypothetical protein
MYFCFLREVEKQLHFSVLNSETHSHCKFSCIFSSLKWLVQQINENLRQDKLTMGKPQLSSFHKRVY